MLVSTDCASAMAKRPQKMTNARRATAPTNLRMRIDMTGTLSSQLRGSAANYMVHAISYKQDDARTDQSVQCPFEAGAVVAVGIGRNDIAHIDCRRSDTSHGIRTFDRGVEARGGAPVSAFARRAD